MPAEQQARQRRRRIRRTPRQQSGEFWADVKDRIDNSLITPYIGNAISNEHVFGKAFAAIIQNWAREMDYPWERPLNVARVAQYWRMREDISSARTIYLQTLKRALLDRAVDDDAISNRQFEKAQEQELDTAYTFSEMVEDLGYLNFQRAGLRNHPLSILAQMPFRIYVTTSYHQFLEKALADFGKETYVSEVYPWKEDMERQHPSIFTTEPNFHPTAQRPLVYHLFGRDDRPDSLVLTENDYLDFVIKVTRDMTAPRVAGQSSAAGAAVVQGLPTLVDQTLTQTSLLLLGYDLHGWDFRVLFQGLITARNDTRSKEGICIQMEPDHLDDKEAFREYLGKYLLTTSKLKPYWGTPAKCMTDLHQLWKPTA